MLLVTGTSGVGKTFTIEAAARHDPSIVRLSGSALLRSLGRPLAGLTQESAKENQAALVRCLNVMSGTEHAVFDGHAILETENGLWPVPLTIVREMGVVGIAFVEDASPLVAQRRVAKGRSGVISDVSRLQAGEQQHSRFLSIELGVPYATIPSGDGEALATIHRKLLVQRT